MTVPQARTFLQTHLAAEHAESVTRWRAVQTVRSNIADVQIQDEVLETLGLVDVVHPGPLA